MVIFTGGMRGASLDVCPAAHELLESLGTRWIEELDADGACDIPPPGPYVAAERRLLEVFRLHDDVQGAFMQSLVPTSRL